MRTLPKVELHLHLDCSLSYRAVAALAPSVTPEEFERDFVAPAKCSNLADFLTRAPKGFLLMQNEDGLRLAVEDLFQQLSDDGVIYAELRFAPLLHRERGLTAERVVEVVDRAVESMIRASGIEARIILCTLRHFTAEQGMQTVQLVERFGGSRVVALDLAGDEAGFPLAPHIAAYEYARERGLHRTAHAGEALGPESVWETLRHLQPSRIGHGVRSIEDPRLVAHLRDHGIHLEVCPSSNVQVIESIHDWPEHPVDRLYRAGVRLNINTDARTLTPTTLNREYEQLAQHFAWGEREFLETNLQALEAAFLEVETKQRLQTRLRKAYAAASQAGTS